MIKFIALFSGTGAFRLAIERICRNYNLPWECVSGSDIDLDGQKIYLENFGEIPTGDITKVDENHIPDHDILLSGFA